MPALRGAGVAVSVRRARLETLAKNSHRREESVVMQLDKVPVNALGAESLGDAAVRRRRCGSRSLATTSTTQGDPRSACARLVFSGAMPCGARSYDGSRKEDVVRLAKQMVGAQRGIERARERLHKLVPRTERQLQALLSHVRDQ